MPLTRRPSIAAPPAEPLAVLLLPRRLEEFDLADHARDLLDVARVVALEPPRFRRRTLLGDDIRAMRQARRLRFPGRPRVIVLYDPHQYHLARSLSAKHEAEVWYVKGTAIEPPQTEAEGSELTLLDQMADEVAVQTLVATAAADPRSDNEPIRRRLVELEIISPHPFVPGAQIRGR
jgi:hypothetical protein